MSRDDDKQVQDALLAIKKLVEMSGDQMGTSNDVLTLDNVVWRNPVKEEAEEAPQDEPEALEEAQIQTSAVTQEAAQKAPVAEASLSVSSRDLDSHQKKELVTHPVTSPPVREDKAPELLVKAEPELEPQPVIRQQETPQPENPQDVTDLTSPLGRRGGGFYSAMTQKPAIKLLADEIRAEPAPEAQTIQQTPASLAVPVTAPNPPTHQPTSHQPPTHEPALTDFHGADFNFSAAEGLMTAASFAELEQSLTRPISAEVQVPVAEPAVSDPVSDVQAMFQDSANQEPEEDHVTYSAHPNLHVVSDQTQEADDEEEGFSGAVRLALRSIIKEQVSTWLQGNMTGLIEEALTTPQKRPSSSSKPSSKKR